MTVEVSNSIAGTVHITGRVVQAGQVSAVPGLDGDAEAAIEAALATGGAPVRLARGEYAAVLEVLDRVAAAGSEAVRALAERLSGR
ncbi:hypothetical protein GCM10009639_11600 [Kitasatospora putterlickiae]|uniref:Uncharacterized protein n=1 Tax=Kitasatospora putterlickiae TaxID=221725 RepID=A0ABP4IGV6_9ACTN